MEEKIPDNGQQNTETSVGVLSTNGNTNIDIVSTKILFDSSLENISGLGKKSEMFNSTEVDDLPTIENENEYERDSPSNRSMTREQRQLQNDINTSKVLQEFFIETRRPRSSRRKSNAGMESDKTEEYFRPSRSRSKSLNARKSRSPSRTSNASSTGKTPKRTNMRSANAEFVKKHNKFLEKVKAQNESDGSDEEIEEHNANNCSIIEDIEPPPKAGSDYFCWRCWTNGQLVACSKCIRSYHLKCIKQTQTPTCSKWKCPECIEIETVEKINRGNPRFDENFLSVLLGFTMKRLYAVKNTELLGTCNKDFHKRYIVKKMTLDILNENVEAKKYRSIEAFQADVKWLLHNCLIYPDEQKPIVQAAKSVIKICKQELCEIETCFECYYKANVDDNWFIEVCSTPHVLVWAKLKGFPYWPAKVMSINLQNGTVGVRFFGAHDRSWVPAKDCFLYSDEDPNGNTRVKRVDFNQCIEEVNQHIQKLKDIYKEFKTAPLRTPFDINKNQEQLLRMLPNLNTTQRHAETTKIVEGLLAGRKPVTVKIFRTADNNLSTALIQDSTAITVAKTKVDTQNKKIEEETIGLPKFKIVMEPNKNYQIAPITSSSINEPGKIEMTMKRNAESWTIMDKNKKNKTSSNSTDEQEERRKLELAESLHLIPNKPQKPIVQNQESNVVENIPKTIPIKPRGRGRPPKTPPIIMNKTLPITQSEKNTTVPHRKRRQTFTGDPQEPAEHEIPEKRVLRNRNKSTSLPEGGATTPKTTPCTEETVPMPESTKTAQVPTTTKTTSPPPLVPFETVIKTEPLSEEEQSSNNDSSAPSQQDVSRIQVRDINTLQKNLRNRNEKNNAVAGEKNKSGTTPTQNTAAPIRSFTNGMISIPSLSLGQISNGPETHQNAMDTQRLSDSCEQLPQLTTQTSRLRSNSSNSTFAKDIGPISKFFIDNSRQLCDNFRMTMEQLLSNMADDGILQAKVCRLELELEKAKQEQEQLKTEANLRLVELKNSKIRETQIANEVRKQCEIEKLRDIEETKRKQWCVQCLREAHSFCCVQAWYCSAKCQSLDWAKHRPLCAQPIVKSQEQQRRKISNQHQKQSLPQQVQIPHHSHVIKPNASTSISRVHQVRLGTRVGAIQGMVPQSSSVAQQKQLNASNYLAAGTNPMQKLTIRAGDTLNAPGSNIVGATSIYKVKKSTGKQ